MSSYHIYIDETIDPSKFKPTRLYIKRIGDLYYFGKTTCPNILSYKGSGVLWKDKIKKYGKEAVVHLWHSDWYTDPIEIQKIALHFSVENDIVNSSKWANLALENGIGCYAHSDTTKKILSDQKIGIKRSVQAREAISRGKTGKPGYWKGKPGHRKGKPSPIKGMPQPQITCPWCNKSGGNSMKRWHFEKCKLFTSL